MLVLQRGAESGRRWPLDRSSPLTIGRNEECDIALPDRQVSRLHAGSSGKATPTMWWIWAAKTVRISTAGSRRRTRRAA